MTTLLLLLLGWVLVSCALGGLWMWAHRPRPEQLVVADVREVRALRQHVRAG